VNLPATTAVAPSAAAPLQRSRTAADNTDVGPRLVALTLLVLLAACGGPEDRPATPAGDGLVGTADVERLLVSTQRRKSPRLRVGAASCPDQVRLIRTKLQPGARAAEVRCGAAKVRVVEIGAGIACTITLGDAVQKVTAVVKDLKGTVVVRG
jgi:hypothetical protein